MIGKMETTKYFAMNLLELIQSDGFTFKKLAATHGAEYAGPCPWCGGNDRFIIWPLHKGGRYWCRGCEKTGDAIQYLRDSHGFSFAEACQILGISKSGYKRKISKPVSEKMVFKPKKYEHPPSIWMNKIEIILNDAQKKLWTAEGKAAREILFGKGLTEETINGAGIGFNPVDLYRDRLGWGLPQEIRCDGKQKLLWIPAGIVIPLQNKDGVVRLRIRRNGLSEGPRYVIVAGSSMAPLVLESGKGAFVIVESIEGGLNV